MSRASSTRRMCGLLSSFVMGCNFAVTLQPHANKDLSQILSGAQSLGHLRQNRKRDFGRTARADGQADRPVNAGEVLVRETAAPQPVEARGMRPLGTQRADIEGRA